MTKWTDDDHAKEDAMREAPAIERDDTLYVYASSAEHAARFFGYEPDEVEVHRAPLLACRPNRFAVRRRMEDAA